MGDLARDRPECLAVGVGVAFEPVEPRRAVEDNQFDRLGKRLGVSDGLALLLKGHRLADDQPRGERVRVRVVCCRELFHPFDREALGVDVQRRAPAGRNLDGCREHDVCFPRRWRTVHLRRGAPVEPAAQELIKRPAACRSRVRVRHNQRWTGITLNNSFVVLSGASVRPSARSARAER